MRPSGYNYLKRMWTRNSSGGSSSKNNIGCGTLVVLFFLALSTFSLYTYIIFIILCVVIGIPLLICILWGIYKILSPFLSWLLNIFRMDKIDIEETNSENNSILPLYQNENELEELQRLIDDYNNPISSNNEKTPNSSISVSADEGELENPKKLISNYNTPTPSDEEVPNSSISIPDSEDTDMKTLSDDYFCEDSITTTPKQPDNPIDIKNTIVPKKK